MLLRRSYPRLRSLDGAGGDGGRDAQLVTADGLTVFEIKSFGRLTSSRRRQVERSLRAAVASAPTMNRWVLVIPMNMSPTRSGSRSGEEAWFDEKLPKIAPGVGLSWWGLDWLDGQIAGNTDIQRYIEGVDGQLLERAREFELERAALANGATDLRDRIDGLRWRVDEVSPFWTLDFSVDGSGTTTTLRAKVPDAHILDPITITPTFRFRRNDPDDEELQRRFESTLSFGGSVVLPAGYVSHVQVDASPEARLLVPDGDPLASEFTIKSIRETLPRPLRCSFQVQDSHGQVRAGFPVFFRERTTGGRGAALYGDDAAGVAKFEVDIPRPSQPVEQESVVRLDGARLQLNLPDSLVGYDIDSLIPVIRTLAAAVEGTRIRLDMPRLGYLDGGPLQTAAYPALPPIAQVVEDLRRMQDLTGSVLRYPANIKNRDVADLRTAVRLLDGEDVDLDGGLSVGIRPEVVGTLLKKLMTAAGEVVTGGFMASADLQLQVGDLTVAYGPAAIWAPHAQIANLTELQEIAANGSTGRDEATMRLEPTDLSFKWLSRLQAEEHLASR